MNQIKIVWFSLRVRKYDYNFIIVIITYYLLNVFKCVRFSSFPYAHTHTHDTTLTTTTTTENSQLRTFHQYNSNPNTQHMLFSPEIVIFECAAGQFAGEQSPKEEFRKFETMKQEKQSEKRFLRMNSLRRLNYTHSFYLHFLTQRLGRGFGLLSLV